MILQMLFHREKVIRIFYKYFNNGIDVIQWLSVSPEENISGLVYMNEYENIEECVEREWTYESFMSNLLNTNT